MRGRLVLILLILYGQNSNAQGDVGSEWDSLFRQIRLQASIAHGCLWEYGCTDTNLLKFEGKDKDDTVQFEQWSDLYEHWRNSVMNISLKPQEKSNLINRFNVYFKSGRVVVPAILAEGSGFRRDAFENKFVAYDSFTNSILVNDPGKAFVDRNVFMAVPFVQSFYQTLPKLFFSDSFFFSNTNLNVAQIHWRLNDGIFAKAEMNVETPLALRSGVNLLTVIFFLSDGTIRRSNSLLTLYDAHASFGNTQLMQAVIGDEKRNIYALPYRKTELEEPLGAYVEVLPGIENGNAHTCLVKPLIFVEGIDFGYRDHPTGCYGGKCGSMGLRDLMRGMIYNPYETNLKNVIEEWAPISRAPKLISDLRQAGYDLVYLDFHNGADYIENNAMLLVELIKKVNELKCSKEEIAIIGASMGGLVTRFALSYMEKNKIPHCVRTFLSFDSPQNGANIALGIQHCLKYYRKKLPGIRDKFDRKLDRAASRQMLIQSCLSENGYKEHGDRIDFVSKLNKLGNYPVHCRKIALLNGSMDSRNQSFDAGDVLLKMNPYLGKFNFDLLEVSSTVYANSALVEGRKVVLIAQYPFKRKQVVEVPFESSGYDHVPGSLRFDLEESRAIYGVFNVINKEDATCFIPSQSALGLYKNDPYVNIQANFPKDRSNPEFHPFEAFYGETESQEHMMITVGNIIWTLDQLESNRNELLEDLKTSYNFGRRQRNRVSDLNVVDGGVLCVNCKGRSGFGNGHYDQVNQYGSDYDLFTTDCGPNIRFFNNSKLEIGAASADGANIGRFHITKGSVIELLPGSVLLVHDYSELIIEEGGELIIHPGVRIILDGKNSKLKVDGFLRLMEQSTLSVESSANGKKGYIHLRNMGNGYGAATILVEGMNVRVNLTGNDRISPILQIEGHIRFGVQNPLSLFQVKNAQITYGNNSLLEVLGESAFDNVEFKLLPWVKQRESSCLKLSSFEHSILVNSVYDRFNIALYAECSDSRSVLELDNCVFKDCNTGIFSDLALIKLNHCRFQGNREYGVLGGNLLNEIQLRSNQMTGNAVGLALKGSREVLLMAEDMEVNNNRVGFDLLNVRSVVGCSRFINNKTGIHSRNGELNISSAQTNSGTGYMLNGGDCSFIQYDGNALLLEKCSLYLDKGNNNFFDLGKGKVRMLEGSVIYSDKTHQISSPYCLLGSGNYWFPVPRNGLKNAGGTLYSLTMERPGSMSVSNLIDGEISKFLNRKCYNGGNCDPCDIEANDKNLSIDGALNGLGDIIVFPLPANDYLNIVSGNYNINNVCIFNLSGYRVYEMNIQQTGLLQIPVTEIESGFYILRIQTMNGIENRRIQIEH